ncbi:MAG: CDP-diacylglycerol--glycerol-3-phosphate 3-phosphatidyltransferase [Gammaproteobacteria bacterium]|nr:CDP-diacylglycerol--glycerol-3-phosphate 3-phosphatidyltransferase [Gammaproteobacteria bacterium]
MKIPNIITMSRIVLIPVFIVVFYLPLSWGSNIGSALVFALAAMTDWLDGYLARRLSQTSAFGAFLDPVADKLLVAVALVLIVGHRHIPALALPAAVIIGREIMISALREWMAEVGKRTSVAVSVVGKIKTVSQMAAILCLLAYTPHGNLMLGVFGAVLLYVAAVLTIWSMCVYMKAAWQDLR